MNTVAAPPPMKAVVRNLSTGNVSQRLFFRSDWRRPQEGLHRNRILTRGLLGCFSCQLWGRLPLSPSPSLNRFLSRFSSGVASSHRLPRNAAGSERLQCTELVAGQVG
jgi:hypothetical protein